MADMPDGLETNSHAYGARHSDDGARHTDNGLPLSEAHRRQLRESAVGDDVARERGYRTETVKARLKSLHLPGLAGLLIPIWNVRKGQASYQLRPDEPRTDKRGKLIKYESPANSAPLLDVHPRLSAKRPVEQLHPDHPAVLPPLIADPRIPLIVTEGTKKGDSGITIGLCCVNLAGVFSFRGKNEIGGIVALPDWESVALKRDVFICFDSDVMCKREVHQALERLGRFLGSRGANVLYIYLSAGPNGEKTGLDDYIVARLAEGLSHEQIRNLLLSQGTAELRKHPGATKSTTDADLIEAAIKRAEAQATAPVRAQYRDENGRLIHAVPLKEKLLLLKSGDTPDAELIEEPEVLPTRSSMSPDGQRRYLIGSNIDLHALLSRLHEFIKARLICRYPWQARLLALWIFGTYMHCTFEYYGYIHATGPSMRAGKSVLLEIVSATSFNAGPVTADPTPAIIYRDANRNCGTQIYDELERLHEDKEKWGAVIGILNVGFKRGATVMRILDPKTDTMCEFGVYSPKAFASIKSLNDTTADRSIRIELLRKKPSEKTESVGDAAALAAAAILRDDCHIAALGHAEVIAGVYSGVAAQMWPERVPDDVAKKLPSPDVDSRARDILKPLLAIAITADHGHDVPEWYPAMLDATAAIAGARGDTGNDELNLIAAATALKDCAPEMLDTFAITSEQAFDLFKSSAELSWLDGDGGARALLRKLGLQSATHRRDRFAVEPSGSKPTAKGYLVRCADLDDILTRYQPDTIRGESV
jgi:hypothetical protein